MPPKVRTEPPFDLTQPPIVDRPVVETPEDPKDKKGKKGKDRKSAVSSNPNAVGKSSKLQ